MKKLKFLIVLLALFCFQSGNVSMYAGSPEQMFTIKKITTKKTYYLIYAERNDSLFKIISYKPKYADIVDNCNKIKAKEKYCLELDIIFPYGHHFGLSSVEIAGIGMADGSSVDTDEKYHDRLYMIKNLIGLCLEE